MESQIIFNVSYVNFWWASNLKLHTRMTWNFLGGNMRPCIQYYPEEKLVFGKQAIVQNSNKKMIVFSLHLFYLSLLLLWKYTSQSLYISFDSICFYWLSFGMDRARLRRAWALPIRPIVPILVVVPSDIHWVWSRASPEWMGVYGARRLNMSLSPACRWNIANFIVESASSI